jgi:nitrate/nitrite transporter NarK
MLERHIEDESNQKQVHPSVISLLRDGRVWLMGLITFSSVMGLYGVAFWLPTIIQGTAVRKPLEVGLMTMIPYGTSMIAMLLVSRNSDRLGERRWHLALSTIFGGCGLVLSVLSGSNSVLAMIGLTIGMAGIITSQPLFWTLPTKFLAGTAAAAGIAMINAMGNLAGFVSPYLIGFIKDYTKSTALGIYVLAFALFVGSALTLAIPSRLLNERRSGSPTRAG